MSSAATAQYNVYLYLASDETVQGNYVGTDVTGSFALSTITQIGIEVVGSSDNLIGGTIAGAGNVISGNASDGVELGSSGTTGNLVAGNLIGTNAAGTAAIPNGDGGVEIDTGASGNTIGGLTATPGTGPAT